jgi:hypothetical protein
MLLLHDIVRVLFVYVRADEGLHIRIIRRVL